MADRTPYRMRGFIVPFLNQTNDNLWASESSIDQGKARTGIPDSGGNDLVLAGKGNLSESIDIKTFRGGHLTDAPAFVWKKKTDTDYYGFDQPNIISDLNIFINNLGSGTTKYTPGDAIQLPKKNKIMVVYEETGSTDNKIYIALKSYTSKIVETVLVDTTPVSFWASTKRQNPCLCLLPDESIICAYWVIDIENSMANIHVNRSIDNGSTWQKISSRALPEDIDTQGSFGAGASGFELDNLSMAANSHQVLLFAGIVAHNESLTNANIIKQYASTSEGATFHLISENDSSVQYADPKVVSFNDVFIISIINDTDTVGFTRLANAFEDLQKKITTVALNNKTTFNTLKVANLTANRWEKYNRAMWVDKDGRMYTAHVLDATGGSWEPQYLECWYSDLKGVTLDKYGQNWTNFGMEPGATSGQLSIVNSSSNGIGKLVAASGVGSQEIFCNWGDGTSNNYKKSIFLISLGGWATRNYPPLTNYPLDSQTAYNILDWIPIDLPDTGATWTKVTTGTPTVQLSKKLLLDGSSSDLEYYKKTITDKTNGAIVHCKMITKVSTTTTAGAGFSVQIQETGSTNTIKIRVVLESDAIHLKDMIGGTQVSDTNIDASEYDFILFVDNSTNAAHLYYSIAPDLNGSPRKYKKLSKTGLATSGTTTQEIQWGILGNNNRVKTEFYYLSFSVGAGCGKGYAPKREIRPKQYPPEGYFCAVYQESAISSFGGPARESDSYSIDPRYDNPIDRILYNVSPTRSVKWSTTPVSDPDTTPVAEQKIAWYLSPDLGGAVDTKPLRDSIGIHFAKVNFREFEIEKYSGGSWSSVGSFSNAWRGGSSFPFIRKGKNIISNTTANRGYLNFNECMGWRIFLDDGAGNTVQRVISGNSAGPLKNTASLANSILTLKSPKSTDPTSGTAYLIPESCTVILNNIGELAALRIKIASQKTASGSIAIGNMVMGPIIIPAPQYSRGRTITFEADVSENQTSDGILYSKKTGIGGRVIRIAWTEGVDISDLYVGNAAPDTYTIYSYGDPVSSVGSAPTTAMGLVRYLNGSNLPLVYLPQIIPGQATQIISDYNDHVMCTMGNDVQIESVLGSESESHLTVGGEVFRVSTIVLRETR